MKRHDDCGNSAFCWILFAVSEILVHYHGKKHDSIPGRHCAGKVAESSTCRSTDIRKRELLGLAWASETVKPTPVTHFLKQGHTQYNKATAPNYFK